MGRHRNTGIRRIENGIVADFVPAPPTGINGWRTIGDATAATYQPSVFELLPWVALAVRLVFLEAGPIWPHIGLFREVLVFGLLCFAGWAFATAFLGYLSPPKLHRVLIENGRVEIWDLRVDQMHDRLLADGPISTFDVDYQRGVLRYTLGKRRLDVPILENSDVPEQLSSLHAYHTAFGSPTDVPLELGQIRLG